MSDSVTKRFLSNSVIGHMLKNRFKTMPGHCTIRSMGHEKITTGGRMTTYKQQKKIISPGLSKLLFSHGNRRLSFVVLIICQIAAAVYTWESIMSGSSPELSMILFVGEIIVSIIYAIVNVGQVKNYAKPAEVWTQPDEESSLSRSAFLMIYGIDALIKEEDDLRKGTDTEGTNLHREIRDKLRRDAAIKAFFFAFLPDALGYLVPLSISMREHFVGGEWILMCLCFGVFISRWAIAASGASVSFYIFLTQGVHVFELKKAQHDVRNSTTEEISLMGFRINSVLTEVHQVCNTSHKFFFMYAPIIIMYGLVLMTAIYNLNVSEIETYRVPVTVIIGAPIPILTILSFYYGYAKINKFFERDIDADLISLRAKLQYAVGMIDSDKRATTELLRALVDADSKACHFPFFIVPATTTATKLIYYFVSGCILVFPYIVAMRNKLIWGYLSMDKENDDDWDLEE